MPISWRNPRFVQLVPGFFVLYGEMWYLHGKTLGRINSENFFEIPHHGKFMCRSAVDNFGFIEHLTAIEGSPTKRFVWAINPGKKLSVSNGEYKEGAHDTEPLASIIGDYLAKKHGEEVLGKRRLIQQYRFLYNLILEFPKERIPLSYRSDWEDQTYETITKIDYALLCLQAGDPVPPNADLEKLTKEIYESTVQYDAIREKRAASRKPHAQGSD